MERKNIRIIAVVVVAAAIVGGSIGAYVFIFAPGAGQYNWSAADCPGAPSTITADQIIKIGVLGDLSDTTGKGAYQGAWLAARDLNLEGGIIVDGKTYYYGITSEDTQEAAPAINTQTGITAAERLINYKNVQYTLGGFRTEYVLSYLNVLFPEKIPFFSCGAAWDTFTTTLVPYFYNGGNAGPPLGVLPPYKYFFRQTPLSLSEMADQIADYIIYLTNSSFNNGYNITKFHIIREAHTWNADALSVINTTLSNNQIFNLTEGVYAQFNPAEPTTWDSVMSTFISNVKTSDDTNQSVIIPFISGSGGQTFMEKYATAGTGQPNSIVCGIDVQSQKETFWSQTSGNCRYEVCYVTVKENVAKTPNTIDFWNNYTTKWSETPSYNSFGAYDSILAMNWAINESQSFDPDVMVTTLETLNGTDYFEGVGSRVAYNPTNHAIIKGYPHGTGMLVQWVDDPSDGGTWTCLPTFWEDSGVPGNPYDIYPKTLAEGDIIIPSWWPSP